MRQIVKCAGTANQFDLPLYRRLNLGLEIQDFTKPDLSQEEKINITEHYERILEDFQGVKALHGPYLDLKPASPDPLIREVSYKRYREAFRIATQLETDFLIFHSQINPFLNEPYLRDLNNRQTRDFWHEITGETDYRGIILIENIFEKYPEMLKEYIETVALPQLKINLDIGHLRIRKAGLEEWIKALKDEIVYIHVHSNDGNYDLHQRPSHKEISNLYDLLDRYDLNPVIALEYEFDAIEDEVARYRSGSGLK